MRQSMMIGSLLNNAETWINVTKDDLNQLTNPDKMLLRDTLSSYGNPSKCFMYLELGIIPVRYVLMSKRMKYLRTILGESMDTMLRNVYETLKTDSRNGDFVDLVQKDFMELNMNFTDKEIEDYSEYQWNFFVNYHIKKKAFSDLVEENQTEEKTKEIIFKKLEMSDYLKTNVNTAITRIIFSIRARTLDIKSWNIWNYDNNMCDMCEVSVEDIDHFVSCASYESEPLKTDWKHIMENDTEKQIMIAEIVQKRITEREKRQEEAGLDSIPGPNAPIIVEQCNSNVMI